MSLTLLKYTTRANWLIGVIFLAIMFLYLSIIITMYDPADVEAMGEMMELLPEELASAMAADVVITDLVSYLASFYYSFLVLIFPIIYCIILGNRLLAKHVDRGSMAYLLSTPHSRVEVATTQAVFMIASVVVLLAMTGLAGLGLSRVLFPGELDVAVYFQLNLGAILLFLAVSGICFFFSCLFNDTKYSLALGGGIPVLFFLISMLSQVGDNYRWLQYLDFFAFYDPALILSGEQSLGVSGPILAGVPAVLYAAGIYLSHRRDLPL